MLDREELFASYALPERVTPRVRVNFISSADGAVTLGGHSGALGGASDRTRMKVLRTLTDVVLVGAGTVRSEGYGGLGLDAEYVQWRVDHGLTPQPRLAIVSGDLHLEPDMSVFTKADVRPLIITSALAAARSGEALSEIADVIACGRDHVDLSDAIARLVELELPQVLCEGGPRLFGSLLEDDLVDEVCLTIAPRFVAGGAGRISVSDTELGHHFRLLSVQPDDEHFLFLHYARDN